MDPVAHTLFGATLAETGLRNTTRWGAALLIIGANLPDVDALTMVLGRDASLFYRRGYTHGVLAWVVLPPLLVLGMALFDRWWRGRKSRAGKDTGAPFRIFPALVLSYLSVLSHPLLDFMNTYGVRLLMPFDGSWFYGDALFIIDPWMWLLMAASVVLAGARSRPSVITWILLALAASALVSLTGLAPWPAIVVWFLGLVAVVVLRLRRVASLGVRWAAVFCLSAFSVYVASMLIGSHVSRERAALWFAEQGHDVEASLASPRPANPFSWDVVLTLPDSYRFVRVNWLSSPRCSEFSGPAPRGEESRVVQAALKVPEVRGLSNWLRLPSYTVQELPDGGYRVIIDDARYARTRSDTEDPHRRPALGHAVVELGKDLLPR